MLLTASFLQRYLSRNQSKCTDYFTGHVEREKTHASWVFDGRATPTLWMLCWGAIPRTARPLLSPGWSRPGLVRTSTSWSYTPGRAKTDRHDAMRWR